MNKTEVRNSLKENTRKVLSVIQEFPETKFNTRPSEQEWSAGEVCEHLIKVETSTVRLCTGKTESCSRDSEEEIPKLKSRLGDRNAKMRVFGPIIPDESPKNKIKVLEKLQDIRQRLIGLIEVDELTELVLEFDHPLFGKLTRIEWIYFSIYHTQRHIYQIEEIAAEVSENPTS